MAEPPPPPPPPPPPSLGLQDIKAVSVLGRGAKGVVFLVRAGSESLALKVVSRTSVEHKKGTTNPEGSYRRIWFERDVLLALRHPLLPSLRGVVETGEVVGFAMDPCSGGDLSALRRRQTEQMFSDDIIRFFAAELVLALEHLHGLGIVYRDLKPENVLIQDNGHLMLVDFDLSTRLPSQSPDPPPKPQKPVEKHRSTLPPRRRRLAGCFTCDSGVSPESEMETASTSASPSPSPSPSDGDAGAGKSNSFVGTEEYVSPEVIEGKGHDFAVDWWGLGVVLYEMLYGRTPFRGQNRKETFYRILTKVPELVGERTPLRDLIARLLDKDPATRIAGGEIKQHEFFRGVDWESVLEIPRPPFIPPPWPEEEDDEGATAIDMESFVRNIFQLQIGKEDNKTQEEEAKTDDFPVF